MSQTPKSGKKQQSLTRETREEMREELTQGHASAQYRNPNRDTTRGDWDRSPRHHDERLDNER